MVPTVGFFAYARADDESGKEILSEIRARLEDLVGKHLGESVKIFQDKPQIKKGEDWREILDRKLNAAGVFIPMLSPRFFKSPECRSELSRYKKMMEQGGRQRYIYPVIWLRGRYLESKNKDNLVEFALSRQVVDWDKHSYMEPADIDAALRKDMDELAREIADTIASNSLLTLAIEAEADNRVHKTRERLSSELVHRPLLGPAKAPPRSKAGAVQSSESEGRQTLKKALLQYRKAQIAKKR